jgi:hypothetical protein
MTKISSVTVGSGGSASISFTGIPQTYTDLVVKVSGRASNPYMDINFNSNGTGFTAKYLYGSGVSYGSGSQAKFLGVVSSTSNTANTFGNMEFYIPNYTSANYKTYSADSVQETNASAAEMHMVAGLWSNTAAITSIQITLASSGTFSQFTTATLYGVTKYAETGTGSKATGGTVTTAGGYTYHTFFSAGMFTPTTNITGAEVLVVAGGGGVSGSVDGGGGAGGLVYASSQSYTSGVGYAAIVGAGGAGGVPGVQSGSNGTNSVFAAGTVAIGGGHGGSSLGSGNGGSGGGQGGPGTGNVGTGTAGQGNAGGAKGSAYGGGGGGAGAAGGTGGANGRGGDGGIGVSHRQRGG